MLKKSFLSDERKFLEPLMRFARGDMRDHIVSHKSDHRASYRRYGALQWRSRLKITFCEIFDVVRFSTFATKSANSRHPPNRLADLPLSPAAKRIEKRRHERGAQRVPIHGSRSRDSASTLPAFRTPRGETPKRARNSRLKCEISEKPTSSATSEIRRALP